MVDKSQSCATRYPLLLVHGLGVRDGQRRRLWGRIPGLLRVRGARVFFGEHDAWGTPKANAQQLLARIQSIMRETGAEKVNLIAHSKGGVDCRYLLALLSAETTCETLPTCPVASLTTLSSPLHGSKALDVLLRLPRFVLLGPGVFVNAFFRATGDKRPRFYEVCRALSGAGLQEFNRLHPQLPAGVFSQQFGACLHGWGDSLVSSVTYLFIARVDAPSDGLVTPASAAWGNYRGTLSTAAGRGVPHAHLVDITQRPFSKRPFSKCSLNQTGQTATATHTTDGPVPIPLVLVDITEFWLALVEDLKARGL